METGRQVKGTEHGGGRRSARHRNRRTCRHANGRKDRRRDRAHVGRGRLLRCQTPRQAVRAGADDNDDNDDNAADARSDCFFLDHDLPRFKILNILAAFEHFTPSFITFRFVSVQIYASIYLWNKI